MLHKNNNMNTYRQNLPNPQTESSLLTQRNQQKPKDFQKSCAHLHNRKINHANKTNKKSAKDVQLLVMKDTGCYALMFAPKQLPSTFTILFFLSVGFVAPWVCHIFSYTCPQHLHLYHTTSSPSNPTYSAWRYHKLMDVPLVNYRKW